MGEFRLWYCNGMRTMRAWPVLLLGGIAGGAFAQGDTIYRCDDGRGGVLYADAPCPGGRVVELPEGKPDPTARERLQRDLDAFERRQAARAAALLRERERQDDLRQRNAPEPARQDEGYASYVAPFSYYAPLYVPPVQRPIKARPRPARTPSFVPVR
jgi:hypothetical protein